MTTFLPLLFCLFQTTAPPQQEVMILLDVEGMPPIQRLVYRLTPRQVVTITRQVDAAMAELRQNHPEIAKLGTNQVNPLLPAISARLSAAEIRRLRLHPCVENIWAMDSRFVRWILDLLSVYITPPRLPQPNDWTQGPVYGPRGDCGQPNLDPENPISNAPIGDDGVFYDVEEIPLGNPPALICLPGDDGEPKNGNFPLAVIAHARGANEPQYDTYQELQNHLSRYGIASVSFDWEYTFSEQEFYDYLEAVLNYIYYDPTNENEPYHSGITRKVSFIGHSVGGGYMVYGAQQLAENNPWGLSLMSVINLAPNPQQDEWYLTPEETMGLLVILTSGDDDENTNSASSSGFQTYDRSGWARNEYTFNGYYKNRFTKSFVYLDGGNHRVYQDQGSGNVQESAFGYITAYLRWSLYNMGHSGAYFKYPEDYPLGSTDAVLQFSEGRYRRVLDNFENNTTNWNSLGGQNQFQNMNVQMDDARDLNSSSPHDTRVMELSWSSGGSTPMATFGLPLPFSFGLDYRDLTGLRHLSFRAGQISPGQNSKDFRIRLTDGSGSTQAVKLSDYGSLPKPFSGASETDSPMNTVLIPLCAFDNLNMERITKISFEFNLSGHTSGTIQLDSLEFLR